VAMTAKSPVDHRHHYGVSMAVADVDGTSHWGGRTYVRDQGPTLLANHGRQEVGRTGVTGDGATLSQELRWLDEHGGVQLAEQRRLTAVVLPEVDAWALRWHGSLQAGAADVEIGSPATNGRPGAGYGGWFWRLPSGDEAVALSPDRGGDVHGARSPWVAVVRRSGSAWTTLVLAQVSGEPDPWFARVGDYVGLGPALAWDAVRKVPAGSSLEVDVVAAVVDRRLGVDDARAVAELAVARVGAIELL
jgi:LacI family transcriptional regulator